MMHFKSSLQFKFVFSIILIVVPLLGIIFLWQGVSEERQAWTQVVNQARILTQQIILTRQWISDSQGVYLREDSPGAQSGNFYTDLIQTERGILRRFTPSMATKQLSRYSYKQNLYHFRLAGLSPMNPENHPDDFEKEAIRVFSESGTTEYYHLTKENGAAVFQYSAPLFVDETCISCHAKQGYTAGTVSGCLTIFLPVQHVMDALNHNKLNLFSSAVGLIVLTVLTLYFLVRRLVLAPVGKLENMASEIARGRFPTPPEIHTGDEMEHLAEVFHSMSVAVEDGRSKLEDKVRSATRELADANAELKTLDRMKTDFLSTMSHELRSPLTAIRGSLDFLRRTEESTDKQDYLNIMEKNVRRLMYLVTDIFDITRIEADKVDWKFAPADISELVDEVLQLMEPQAESVGVSFRFESPGPMEVEMDSERMEQVLVNLTDNAIKYSPKGGTITFDIHSDAGEMFLHVRDNGSGISDADKQEIFKKFHTTPSSGGEEKPVGTGLGLAICVQIVKAHGGRIWVQDNAGGGSDFVIALPCPES